MKKNFALQTLLLLALSFLSCEKGKPKPNIEISTVGCGDFIVYQIIPDDKILSVWIDRDKIAFSKDFQTFDNIATEDFATVEIEQNCDIEAVWYGICNDVFQQPNCQSTFWTLQKGILSFKVSEVPTGPSCTNFYLATVILENAEFKKDNSTETLTFDRVEFNNIGVGWCAG
ncbi:MAG: hypothetical protein ACKVT2_07490 [Saprospiraceae bacterium]